MSLLDIVELSLQSADDFLVILLLVPELGLQLENGLVALLDGQVEVVDDVLGLPDVALLLCHGNAWPFQRLAYSGFIDLTLFFGEQQL